MSDSQNEKAYIAVIGVGTEDKRTTEVAHRAGRRIAEMGGVLICGGLGGVMNAAAEGAREAGGTSIGILPGESRSGASRYLDYVLPTGMGHARNAIIVLASDGLIAVGGGYGTLSEIALALKSGKPVIGLDTWGLVAAGRPVEPFPGFEDPELAVEALFSIIQRNTSS